MTEQTGLAPEKEPSGAVKMFGDFAPALGHFTDDTLFGQVWTRPELSPRDRSLVTVAALATAGNTEQLTMLRAAAARCCGRRPAPEVRTAGCRHRG
jgi:alkylhydroperoxidase/carboxymuconolactone decarboxylase family protein YurZ